MKPSSISVTAGQIPVSPTASIEWVGASPRAPFDRPALLVRDDRMAVCFDPLLYGVSVTLTDTVPSATRSIPRWNSASGSWCVTIRSIGNSPFASIEIAIG